MNDRPPSPSHLARCTGCALPRVDCLCSRLPKVSIASKLVVWMHRAEARKTSNTARLAVRAIDRAELVVFGRRDVTTARPHRGDEAPPWTRPLVLFPLGGAAPLTRALVREHAPDAAPLLLVPDGTWAQAQRLMQRAATCPGARIVCLPPAKSRYELRRRPREGTLSTFEAIAHALAVLEGEGILDELLPVFDAFVASTRRARGRRAGAPCDVS